MKLTALIACLIAGNVYSFTLTSINRKFLQRSRLNFIDPHSVANDLSSVSSLLPNGLDNLHLPSMLTSEEAASIYTKIDKTGFIGFIATYIEEIIDIFRGVFMAAGIKNAYGPAIMLFTIIVRILTIPLTTQQLASTAKIQKLTPLQQKIQAKYANDEQTKSQLLAQLFQAAKANPLAGCLPALIQLPVFISLYRALTNLVAENKLDEPFLWIPDLEGPVYAKPPSESIQWIYSVFSGQPVLGWSDTLAFFSLPVLLYIAQSISTRVLQPPRDKSKPMTEQEQVSQNLLVIIPFIASFFCLNAPASLSLYWLTNSISATIATVFIKNTLPNEPFPPEVDQIMALVDAGGPNAGGRAASRRRDSELSDAQRLFDERPKPSGFGRSVIDVEGGDVTSPTATTDSDNTAPATDNGNKVEDNDQESSSSKQDEESAAAGGKKKGGKRSKRRN
jgi:YidC/Oxa1 family membrane protein insertase